MKVFKGLLPAALILLAGAGAVFAGGSRETAAPAADAGTVINLGIGTAWDTLNPYDSSSGAMYSQQVWDKIYDRLAFLSAGGTVIRPRNADSWESADGGRAVVFHLNRKAAWHDGAPLTARDWVFTVNLITNPEAVLAGGTYFSFLAGTDNAGKAVSPGSVGVEAVDDYTLKLTLKNNTTPESFLILYNRNFYVLPEHLLKDIPPGGIKTAEFWKNPVGSGPTIFESELVGSRIAFKANPQYPLGAPGFGTLIISVIASSNLLSSFIAGDLDLFGFGNGVSVDERLIAEQSGFRVINSAARTGFSEIILNNKTIPPEIRLALHYALDKDALVELSTQGLGVPSFSSVLPSSEYYNHSLKIERDLNKTRELLAAGGYDGRTYTFVTGAGWAERVAVMQQQWAEAGIKVDTITVDAAAMFSGMSDGKYDIGLAGHSATAEPLWFASHISYTQRNYFSITDPSYDQWRDRIQAESDPAKRKQLILDYQKFIFDTTPYIPLWHQGSLFVVSKTVENVDSNAAGLCNENVWDWVKR
jgi:peptide/nickel transport system substrate-binding protein